MEPQQLPPAGAGVAQVHTPSLSIEELAHSYQPGNSDVHAAPPYIRAVTEKPGPEEDGTLQSPEALARSRGNVVFDRSVSGASSATVVYARLFKMFNGNAEKALRVYLALDYSELDRVARESAFGQQSSDTQEADVEAALGSEANIAAQGAVGLHGLEENVLQRGLPQDCEDRPGGSTSGRSAQLDGPDVTPALDGESSVKAAPAKATATEESSSEAARQSQAEPTTKTASPATDYDEFKTLHIFGSDESSPQPEYQERDDRCNPADDELLSPRYWQEVLHHHHRHERLDSSNTADLDPEFWNFDVKCWLGEDDEEAILDDGDHQRRAASTQQSPASKSNDACSVHSLLMGSPTDFALRQSGRNARYNALRNDFSPPDSAIDMPFVSQTEVFSPNLPCKDPSLNRFSVLALDRLSSSPDSPT